MKTLFLLRHASAVNKNHESDFTRILSPAGLQQGKDLAAYWKSKNYRVDFAMCSAAVRAEQTLGNLLDLLGTDQILISNNFYNIQEDEMRTDIQECGTRFDNILYVGHNPGIAFFAMRMAKVPPEAMTQGYSPGTLCVLQFDIDDWSNLDWNSGDVTDYWSPPKKETPSEAQ